MAPLADGGAVVAIDYRSDGDGDLTVARYSATNEVTWATTWSTEVEDAPMRGAIDVDADGNALVGVSLFDSSSGDRDAA
ncbi:MAG: hypothetical protein GWN79_15215, partial [Actinobacteria bacterium]|nr:hypothetical protein [Actinomycetota bacterium]NIU20344.1 hypothetical protein [Actinomycetota bacterium]NIU68040.1 hypothetical protein [Actinomycetota bacterium]NIW29829.1 hypothetical protein [Actinomycetota bacterium]NIX22330.1 hypothetical protein [Actinomycetota bacterium]